MTFDEDNALLTRFISEMRAVAKLQHPNIVAAFEAGKTSSTEGNFANLYYFIMEFIAGVDLEQYVADKGKLAPTRVCDLGYQVASAFTQAYRKHLVHRDIKPSNILLAPDDQAKELTLGWPGISSNGM